METQSKDLNNDKNYIMKSTQSQL